MHTPAFPVFLTSVSQCAAAELAGDLAATGRLIQGVNAESDAAEAFAEELAHHTGAVATVTAACGCSCSATQSAASRARGCVQAGRRTRPDLLTVWLRAFTREVGDPDTQDDRAAADERISYGVIIVWEAGGAPASIAGRTRIVAGMARVVPSTRHPSWRARLRGRRHRGRDPSCPGCWRHRDGALHRHGQPHQ